MEVIIPVEDKPAIDVNAAQAEVNKANATKLLEHDNLITGLQVISFALVIVLLIGFITLLFDLQVMRQESDQFKSQLFIDLIKETQDTNAKINSLIK